MKSLALAGLLLLSQDLDGLLQKADALLEQAKSAYEDARGKSSPAGFIDAGFKLEEARIKYLVLQEVGTPEKQKTAADRLRAVNQLGKLIHDGKVAVTGTPAAEAPAPAPKPADPAAPEPVVKPAPPPPPVAAPAPDVLKRAAVPDAAQQRSAEKAIKDLYKEQYARKAALNRQTLARTLLDQAAKSVDDAAALWVLCREAQDIAAQVPDARLAVEAIDLASRYFDIDPVPLKSAALAAAAKNAKTGDEYRGIVEGTLQLVDELVATDQYEAADKAAASALQLSKKANDAPLVVRVGARAKEVSEARTRFVAIKGVLQTLADKPDDPAANAEMGQFLCFVKGGWELGPRFLAKGTDSPLKEMALKEVSIPPGGDLLPAADGWWDLGEKDPSPLRKGQMQLHARDLYETALPSLTGLMRIKVEKRIGEPRLKPGQIDLLALIDPKKDAIKGAFAFEGKTLVLQGGDWDRLQIQYEPPDEYDVRIVAERKTGIHNLNVGLVNGGNQFLVMMDAGDKGDLSGLDFVNMKPFYGNSTTLHGPIWPVGKAQVLEVAVRKTGVAVMLSGKRIMDWKGPPSECALYEGWKLPQKNTMMLGSWNAQFHITQFLLTPVTGQGRKLR